MHLLFPTSFMSQSSVGLRGVNSIIVRTLLDIKILTFLIESIWIPNSVWLFYSISVLKRWNGDFIISLWVTVCILIQYVMWKLGISTRQQNVTVA